MGLLLGGAFPLYNYRLYLLPHFARCQWIGLFFIAPIDFCGSFVSAWVLRTSLRTVYRLARIGEIYQMGVVVDRVYRLPFTDSKQIFRKVLN